MAIKITTPDNQKQEPKPYPKLMELTTKGTGKGTIVFFTNDNSGIILKGVGCYELDNGDYDTKWDYKEFTDYNDPITIQNA